MDCCDPVVTRSWRLFRKRFVHILENCSDFSPRLSHKNRWLSSQLLEVICYEEGKSNRKDSVWPTKHVGSLSIICMVAIAGNEGYILKQSTVELTNDLKGLLLLNSRSRVSSGLSWDLNDYLFKGFQKEIKLQVLLAQWHRATWQVNILTLIVRESGMLVPGRGPHEMEFLRLCSSCSPEAKQMTWYLVGSCRCFIPTKTHGTCGTRHFLHDRKVIILNIPLVFENSCWPFPICQFGFVQKLLMRPQYCTWKWTNWKMMFSTIKESGFFKSFWDKPIWVELDCFIVDWGPFSYFLFDTFDDPFAKTRPYWVRLLCFRTWNVGTPVHQALCFRIQLQVDFRGKMTLENAVFGDL